MKTEAVTATPLLLLEAISKKNRIWHNFESNGYNNVDNWSKSSLPGPSHLGIIKTTGSDTGPLPNVLVTNIVIDTLALEVRQGEGG